MTYQYSNFYSNYEQITSQYKQVRLSGMPFRAARESGGGGTGRGRKAIVHLSGKGAHWQAGRLRRIHRGGNIVCLRRPPAPDDARRPLPLLSVRGGALAGRPPSANS